MRNLLPTLIMVVLMSWISNAQAQPLTVDPESVVPLPDTFDMETPAPDVPPEMARFQGMTTGISSWSSASGPMGMRTWCSPNRTPRSTA
ncbi:hypothetical protein [Bradyrhizobium prioriisuperbiae]|uniref:hypothetical protein n=1 Tax=Bradyrhizobium prioriisuperbiae TaxID=2854389 RepID=UPI0028E985CF|nr:hypothetical protein [Bradyrhizobium prioritasuperba]